MRGTFVVQPGAIVGCLKNDHAHVIRAWIDRETVVVEDMTTGFSSHLSIHELTAYNRKKSTVGDLMDLTPKQRAEAKKRYKAIEPLIGKASRKAVEERGQELQLSTATLYRWLSAYAESGVISSLIRGTRSDKGNKKLTDEQEALIKSVIEKEYLTDLRIPITEAYESLKAECRKAKIKTPHLTTLRSRILDIGEELRLSKRFGKQAAKNRFSPKAGKYPDANYPYSVIQIDHKRLDTIVVDDRHRFAIDRPWITVAIDVNSRMVAGYYLSTDSPSSLSVGMCLAMTILPKEKLFAAFSLEGKWPCFGLPTVVHVDNAKEFRGEALSLGAKEYGFQIAFRKVKRPEYGGHIESLLGSTFTNGLSRIPGRTFSNPVERGEYDSAKKSVMTLNELDVWIFDFIANTYNIRKHSQIFMPPIHKYTTGILGSDGQPGSGRVTLPVSGDRLLKDFLPVVRRPVHRSGIIIDNIWYYEEVLNRFINARDPEKIKNKRKFIIRRDPRDISYIWFYDPEITGYHKISYRNLGHPPMSLWEYRALRKWMVEQGIENTDEDAIFRSLERRKELISKAAETTKKARRELQRSKHHKKPLKSHEAVAPKPDKTTKTEEVTIPVEVIETGDIEPFDEIEIY